VSSAFGGRPLRLAPYSDRARFPFCPSSRFPLTTLTLRFLQAPFLRSLLGASGAARTSFALASFLLLARTWLLRSEKGTIYTTTGIKKLPQELNLIPVVVVIPKALPSGITTTIGIKL